MNDRVDSISDPWARTFEWLLSDAETMSKEQGSVSEARIRFLGWLSAEQPRGFWICGKAGSGKSTLMKRLFSNGKVKAKLEGWAAPGKVAFASFYFSQNSKVSIQKTPEAFLRAIIHQLVSESSELLELLSRHLQHKNSRSLQPWTWSLLRDSIKILCEQPEISSKVKLCMFVDGLDECSHVETHDASNFDLPYPHRDNRYLQARRGDYRVLQKLVLDIMQHPNVKMCFSSRPLNSFFSAFATFPVIHLEQLTAFDINNYVSDRLAAVRQWEDLQLEAGNETGDMIETIVGRARGVFLWVKLVIDRIVSEIEDGAYLTQLKQLVDDLPEELDDLYRQMLRSVLPGHRGEATRYFQLVLASWRPLSAILLGFAETKTTQDVIVQRWSGKPPISSGELHLLLQNMQQRVRSRSAGLLEISEFDPLSAHGEPEWLARTVQFMHLTTKEFFLSEKNWAHTLFGQDDGDSFPNNLALLRASVLGLKLWPDVRTHDNPAGCVWKYDSQMAAVMPWKMVYDSMHYARLVDDKAAHIPDLILLLDDLDSTAGRMFECAPACQVCGSWVDTEPQESGGRDFHVDNFLCYAVQAGLLNYVKQKVQVSVPPTINTPLLAYAVATSVRNEPLAKYNGPWEAIGQLPADPEMVRYLLSCGADPNECYRTKKHSGNETVWSNVLQMTGHVMDGGKLQRPSVERGVVTKATFIIKCQQRWIANMKLLIQVGADPNCRLCPDLCTRVGRRTWATILPAGTPALEVVGVVLGNYPHERDEIIQMLLDRGAENEATSPHQMLDVTAVPDRADRIGTAKDRHKSFISPWGFLAKTLDKSREIIRERSRSKSSIKQRK